MATDILNSKIKKKKEKKNQEMEIQVHYSLSYAKANSLISPTIFAHRPLNFVGFKNCQHRKLESSERKWEYSERKFGGIIIRAAAGESGTAVVDASVRWILQPIGDGDFKHIGYKTAMPGAFEIASDVVTVGRVREKADIVISVPTVSGLHARIRKTEENLLITDLDSTNGTYIDEKRLQPGVVSAASPGNLIIFGDANLAIFRVSKLEKEEFGAEETEESGAELEDEPSSKVE
ncbi:hypothetical protein ABFX02_14G229100 [Erythranthe guttata]